VAIVHACIHALPVLICLEVFLPPCQQPQIFDIVEKFHVMVRIN